MDDYLVQVGKPTGLIFGYVYDGIYPVSDFDAKKDPESDRYIFTLKSEVPSLSSLSRETVQPGSTKYKDTNGDNLVTPDDRVVIGNTNPKHFGGITNFLSYRNFDLSVFLNWSYGNDVLNYARARILATYQPNQNQSSLLKNRFTYINNHGDFITDPKLLESMNITAKRHAANTAGPESNRTLTTSEFVEDGSFLRISNLTLGYTFNPRWTKRIKIRKLRIYFTAHNLYTFTNYSGFDPEVSKRSNGGLTPGIDYQAYPGMRSLVFGLNLNF